MENSLGLLVRKYEETLAQLEENNEDYENLVGCSDEDYYSYGERNGAIEQLKKTIKDLREILRGD